MFHVTCFTCVFYQIWLLFLLTLRLEVGISRLKTNKNEGSGREPVDKYDTPTYQTRYLITLHYTRIHLWRPSIVRTMYLDLGIYTNLQLLLVLVGHAIELARYGAMHLPTMHISTWRKNLITIDSYIWVYLSLRASYIYIYESIEFCYFSYVITEGCRLEVLGWFSELTRCWPILLIRYWPDFQPMPTYCFLMTK